MFGIESNIRLSIHFPYSVGSRFNGIVVDIYKGKTLYNTETEIWFTGRQNLSIIASLRDRRASSVRGIEKNYKSLLSHQHFSITFRNYI